uniref:Uncharacterized protein n=1 Tax=Arundo donax TaxID=35708 RepID=A0A0A8Y0E4_ARUDO
MLRHLMLFVSIIIYIV